MATPSRYAATLSKWLDAFERVVTIFLIVLMAGVVVLSVVDLGWILIRELLLPGSDHLSIERLLEVFGGFLIVLIGVELLETLRAYAYEREIRAEVIVLVAVIAVARKLITLESHTTGAGTMLALAAIVAALSIAYHLIRRAHGRPAG